MLELNIFGIILSASLSSDQSTLMNFNDTVVIVIIFEMSIQRAL